MYHEVAALRERVPAWQEGKPLFALDTHGPDLCEEKVYFLGSPNESSGASG